MGEGFPRKGLYGRLFLSRIPYPVPGARMPETPMKEKSGVSPANIDPEELAKFASLAPIWWTANGAFKALHDINGLRVGYIDGRVPLAGKTVLDLGCGGGILAEALSALGASVTGIDAGEEPWRSQSFT